jgi:hypothetical protein
MESMYNSSVIVEKQCMLCKVGAGVFFTGFGLFHLMRFASLWHVYRLREKIFNAGATSFVFAIAAANFYAAGEIYMGKEMKPIEMRPSYT